MLHLWYLCFIFLLVTEWVGHKEGLQDVLIHFMPERKQLSVSLLNKQILRSIDLKHVHNVELQVSVGGHLHYVLVRIVREYDLVSTFIEFFFHAHLMTLLNKTLIQIS